MCSLSKKKIYIYIYIYISRQKCLTPEEITACLRQLGNLSENDDEREKILYESNISLDFDINEEGGTLNDESNKGEFHTASDGTLWENNVCKCESYWEIFKANCN